MTHSLAIVFDSSGTLMHTYRVAKDVRTDEILHNVVSLHLIRRSQALVAIDAPPDLLFDSPQDMGMQQFIKGNDVEINIGCASDEITTDDVRSVLNHDSGGVRVSDLVEVVTAVRKKCKDVRYIGTGFVIDVPTGEVQYVVCSGGMLFDGAKSVIAELMDCAEIYIASGDSMRNLSGLARHLGIMPANVVPVATPAVKHRLVDDLKKVHDYVVMVGDEINDLRAIRAADLGVLTLQQCPDKMQKLCDSADILIPDISKLPDVIREWWRSRQDVSVIAGRSRDRDHDRVW